MTKSISEEDSTKTGLQRFLGMLNYYRRFLPSLADLLEPLHGVITDAGKAIAIAWSDNCQSALSKAKGALVEAFLLAHPNPFSKLALTVDVRDVARGAELSQRGLDGGWFPIAFFLRHLLMAERNYSAFGRELLAIYVAIRRLCHFLEGRPLTVFTDHKPLTFALSSTRFRSPRQSRHLSFVSEFTNDIQHVSGSSNVVAEALSRPEDSLEWDQDKDERMVVGAVWTFPINFAAMAEAQLRMDLVSLPSSR